MSDDELITDPDLLNPVLDFIEYLESLGEHEGTVVMPDNVQYLSAHAHPSLNEIMDHRLHKRGLEYVLYLWNFEQQANGQLHGVYVGEQQ